MANSGSSTSPVNGGDYEGLQVDTRAEDSTDKHLDPEKSPHGRRDWGDLDDDDAYLNEKQIATVDQNEKDEESPISPGATLVADPESPHPKTIDDTIAIASGVPPMPKVRRICGMRRRYFWIAFGAVLIAVIVASIVGGVVGGRKKQTALLQSLPGTTLPPPVVSGPSSPSDVIVDSPLCVLSYDNNGTGSPASRQSFRIYYQSVIGNIKESASDGLSTWQTATPIFTDAINNTGLAALTYINGTQQQGSIFYVGMNGNLQEKRMYDLSNRSGIWLPTNLNDKNIPMVGNMTDSSNNNNDSKNDWDSYRMAAVYSANFQTGPGSRLYYHTAQLNGTSWVQELIWTQQNDSWSMGATFYDAWPSSHLAATIDENTKILRLFFSSGNLTLSEYYTNISSPNPSYHKGLQLPSYLHSNNGNLAALSTPTGTSLFHVAPHGIRELRISGSSLSANNQESFNSSEPLVAALNLTSTASSSLYQPLTASTTVAKGLETDVYAFWADAGTGDVAAGTGGYSALKESSRGAFGSWPAGNPVNIPLGSNNAQPVH